MWRRLFLAGSVILASLALAAPAPAAYLESAHLTVVQHAQKPTWKVTYLLCHTAPGRPRALISEFTYRQGARNSTYQAWMWGKKTLQPPSERGGGRCSWYHSETYRSHYPQRAGYVNGVTLEIFDPNGQTITRSFRLHP